MNGYEKHSDDYGGPNPGWGTLALITALVVVLVIGLAIAFI